MRTKRYTALLAATLVAVLASPALAAKAGKEKKAPKKAKDGWYLNDALDDAVEEARLMGRPLAIIYRDSGPNASKTNGAVTKFKRAPGLKQFVRVLVNWPGDIPPVLMKMLDNGGREKQKPKVPLMFLGTYDGGFFGVANRDAPRDEVNAIVKTSLREYGPLIKTATMKKLWARLKKARELWGKKEFSEAMGHYRKIKATENNPRHAISAELGKDAPAINALGKQELNKATDLFKSEKYEEAKSAASKVRAMYKGFEPADEAAALLRKIQEKMNPKESKE